MTEPILDIRDLVIDYGIIRAVKGINLQVEKGSIVAILGANGAGKTTAMKILCGLSRPTSGKALVAGYDASFDSEKIKKNIGYMSQRFSLYEDLTVWENFWFYGGIYGMRTAGIRQKFGELMERLRFTGQHKTLVRSLPLGWKQKLAFSVAVFHSPSIVFLDEPTGGVDPIVRRQFWDLIYEAAETGTTVVVTTHYMDEAEFCNKVGMMYNGRLIKVASPDTIKSEIPGFLLSVECGQPAKAEKFLRDQPNVMEVSLHGTQLHVWLSKKEAKSILLRGLKNEEVDVMHSEFIQPSLEDVFISMIEGQESAETSE